VDVEHEGTRGLSKNEGEDQGKESRACWVQQFWKEGVEWYLNGEKPEFCNTIFLNEVEGGVLVGYAIPEKKREKKGGRSWGIRRMRGMLDFCR